VFFHISLRHENIADGKIIDIRIGYGEGSLKGRLSRHLRK